MLEREPPAHTRLRRLVNRAFLSRAVQRLHSRVRALADAVFDALAEAETVDLLRAHAEPIPAAVIAEMLGVPIADAQLLGWSHRMAEMCRAGRITTAAGAEAGRTRSEIATHRSRP